MPFDALTIAAVRHELEQKIVGGHVQNVAITGPLSINLEIYRAGTGRTNLLLSAHAQDARVYLSKSAPGRDPSQHPPLLLLLRKYLRGGTLANVYQPPYERVLGLSIAKKMRPHKHQEYHFEGDFRHTEDPDEAEIEDEDAPIVTVELIVEVMGRVSNIVLVGDDGAILDSIKRIPPSINRYRTTLPHQRYVPPPPQEKREPMTATINSLARELLKVAEDDDGAAAWKGLVAGFAAVSPPLAREVVFQALGSVAHTASEVGHDPLLLARVHSSLQTLFTSSPQPTFAWREREEGERQPIDFAGYPLMHLEAAGAVTAEYDSMSEAISEYFAAQESQGKHGALRSQVRAEIEDLRGREERRLTSLREQLVRAGALEELRRKGEYLMGYSHAVQPGQRELVIPEEGLTIKLDPDLSAVENAQALFKEYRKARSAQEGLPERVAEVEMRVAFFDELLTSLELAASHDEIRAVQVELGTLRRADAGQAATDTGKQKRNDKSGKGRKQQEKLPQPLRTQTTGGIQLLVGRTAGQNDTATFRLAAPEDLWFHARNIPGAHVILRATPGLTDGDIVEAARLAAAYSSAYSDSQVDVIYTEKRHVRKVPNSPPGFVTYKNERALRVEPGDRRMTDDG